MAVFPKFKITNKGLNYLNRSVAEKKALTFTKFKIGDAMPTGNWEELNDIVASFKEFSVLETSVQANKVVRIKGYFDNKGLSADKKLKEIGVYATLEGVPEEILYSYTNAGDTADTVPDENNGFFSRTFDVANYIGNATQVTYTVEQATKDFDFNTIQEIQNATFLKAGDRVHLWGETQLGDTTTKTLIITDTYSGNNDKYTLKNNKIAVVINDINKKQNKQDNTLETTAKEIVPAINEVNQKIEDIPTGDYLEKGKVSKEFDTAKKIEDEIKKRVLETDFDSYKNKENETKVLYTSQPDSQTSGTRTLNESLKNFREIEIKIQYTQFGPQYSSIFRLLTSQLTFNDTDAPNTNKASDYMFISYSNAFVKLVFRTNGINIEEFGNVTKVVQITGIGRIGGF